LGSAELELLLAEIARLLKEGKEDLARKYIKKSIEILCEMSDSYTKISYALDILGLISKLSSFEEENLISVKFCVSKPDKSDEVAKLMYAKFLAIYASVMAELGYNPIEEIEESDKILYELTTKVEYLKQYASFTNIFYAPIYAKIGKVRKALKALDFVIDELEGAYNRGKDESLLAILGETKAYKAKLLIEMGEKEEGLRIISEAKSIFKSLKGNYEDYLEFLDELEKEAKKKS